VRDGVLAGLCRMRRNFRAVLVQALLFALLCGGLTTCASTAAAQTYTFGATGDMVTPRAEQTAILLNNGKVLIAGGFVDSPAASGLASAELYDPATAAFTATGNMTSSRFFHTATLLNNGKVLVVGGAASPGGDPVASAELYDPATETFTATGNMTVARTEHTATVLADGRVLVAGGVAAGNVGLGSAELYDPTTGTFTATGSMTSARWAHTSTLLSNGKVLVTGGIPGGDAGLASAELYDPSTGIFAATGNMNTPRYSHTATLLSNGQVLIVGGFGLVQTQGLTGPGVVSADDLYDPTTGTFTATGSMNTPPRYEHAAKLLTNNLVLVTGGDDGSSALNTADLYDVATGTFAPTASMNLGNTGRPSYGARIFHTATLLNDGTMLVAGGYSSGGGSIAFPSAELFETTFAIVSPGSLTFGSQATGTTSASQTITLTNTESTTLNITRVAIGGTNLSDFAETDNCLGSVAIGASCSITVTFTPTAAGSRVGSVLIVNNSSSPLYVPLSGMAVTAGPAVSLSSAILGFADQAPGTTSPPQTVTLTNTGKAILNIQTVVITGGNGFAVANDTTCTNGVSVAVSSSCLIQVTFTPTAPGQGRATVVITDSAADSPQQISLVGNSGLAAVVSVSPTSISFPGQYLGTSGLPQTVTVTNNGSLPLTISSVVATPADFGQLSSCGNSLAPNASCAIGVFFDPTTGGTRTGTLTITDSAAGSPQTVTLTGSGQDFSMALGSATSATVSPGQTASYSIAVAPAGGFAQSVALSCGGGPTQSTCTVSPSSIALSAKSAMTAMVTVTTVASAQGPVLPYGTGWPIQYRQAPLILALMWMSLLMAAVLLLSRREQRFRWAHAFSLAVLVCLAMTLTACGGGSGRGGSTSPQAGTYTVTVTGNFSSGSTTLTRSAKLTLVVQ
jgi:hypothetical protein